MDMIWEANNRCLGAKFPQAFTDGITIHALAALGAAVR